ncbi:MAG: hypothetical protein ACXQTD_09645 [Candidatus Syntropharchaeia archaeon]
MMISPNMKPRELEEKFSDAPSILEGSGKFVIDFHDDIMSILRCVKVDENVFVARYENASDDGDWQMLTEAQLIEEIQQIIDHAIVIRFTIPGFGRDEYGTRHWEVCCEYIAAMDELFLRCPCGGELIGDQCERCGIEILDYEKAVEEAEKIKTQRIEEIAAGITIEEVE